MIYIIGFLTFVMVVVCLFLILLVLVQLPKKDAGAGMAFGAGTADALFGAGSGNFLTKITGWTAGILLALALALGKLQSMSHTDNSAADFTRKLEQTQQQIPVGTPATQPKPPSAPPTGNNLLSTPMQTPATNAPVPATTNPAK